MMLKISTTRRAIKVTSSKQMWVSEGSGSYAYEEEPDCSGIGGDWSEGMIWTEGAAAGGQCGLHKPSGVGSTNPHGRGPTSRPAQVQGGCTAPTSSSDKLIYLFMVRKSGNKVTFISAYMCVFF